MDQAYQTISRCSVDDVLSSLKRLSPARFEQVVVDVLVAMGYGGTREDAANVVGKSRDGGIDGVIKEDRLGLDTIYVQAKRWDGTVGRGEVASFVGSLLSFQSGKGVFITTGTYSADARRYIDQMRSDKRVVLIDGPMLARLMIEHGVGVTVAAEVRDQAHGSQTISADSLTSPIENLRAQVSRENASAWPVGCQPNSALAWLVSRQRQRLSEMASKTS